MIWNPASRLPDSDTTVLVATRDHDEPVWLGYHDGEHWCLADGMPVEVTHWAPMPEPPVVKPAKRKAVPRG